MYLFFGPCFVQCCDGLVSDGIIRIQGRKHKPEVVVELLQILHVHVQNSQGNPVMQHK